MKTKLYLRIDLNFFFGSWRNKLKNVVHSGLGKGVYHIFEFISNEPNKKLWPTFFSCPKNILSDNNCLKRIKIKKFPKTCDFRFKILSMEININFLSNQNLLNTWN
jgi:hypothetical protein